MSGLVYGVGGLVGEGGDGDLVGTGVNRLGGGGDLVGEGVNWLVGEGVDGGSGGDGPSHQIVSVGLLPPQYELVREQCSSEMSWHCQQVH